MPTLRRPLVALVLLLALGGTGALTGCARPADVTTSDAAGLPAVASGLRVTTDGAVRVETAAPGAVPSVDRTVRSDHAPVPALAVRTDGDTLTVDGRCGDGCAADLVLRVPGGRPVRVEATAGPVTVSGTGPADLHSEAGTIAVSDVAGGVAATSQAGAVDARRVSGPVDAGSEAGPVTVEELVPADVSARSTAADVTVTVPQGAYRVDVRDIDGAQSAVPDDPAGRWTLRAESTAGQARLLVR